MPSGVYKRTPEHIAANSKARTGVPLSPKHIAAIKEAKKGVPQSPEHIAAVKKGIENSDAVKAYHDAQIGIPLSPEHIAAIKIGMENSDANKAQIGSMRGGNDLVTHHYIYDHDDLSLNTIQMTRSDHMMLHMLLKKLGYIVTHINTEES